MSPLDRLFAVTVLAGLAPLVVSATPSGPVFDPSQVGSIENSGGVLTVTTTAPRTIINWDDFSIGANEGVHFSQPSAGSAVLNRVTGLSPSAIDGTLSSNGAVYLINPNGIAISSSGVVDTAGFIASTLDLSDDSFLSGEELYFSGDSTASVINAGIITVNGGNAFLIAQQVSNTGTINAVDGTAGLAAGSEVLVYETYQEGSEQLYVLAGEGTVSNQGLITAATAELKAVGGNTFALAINNEGIIRATTLTEEGGRIFLRADNGAIANSGELTASGSTGQSGLIEFSATEIKDTGVTTAGQIFSDYMVYLNDPIYMDIGSDEGSEGGGEVTDNQPVLVVYDDVIYTFGPDIFEKSDDLPYLHPVAYNYRTLTGDPVAIAFSGTQAPEVRSTSFDLTRFQADLQTSPALTSLSLTPSTGTPVTEAGNNSETPL